MKEKELQGRWMMEKGGLKSVGEKGGGVQTGTVAENRGVGLVEGENHSLVLRI